MKRILNSIICLVLCFGFVSKSDYMSQEDYLSSHLNEYADINETHHDNIDREGSSHVHRHKHSEDGEEHEHNHSHTAPSQVEVKLMVGSYSVPFSNIELESNQGYGDKHLISSPYPMDILRPPIS